MATLLVTAADGLLWAGIGYQRGWPNAVCAASLCVCAVALAAAVWKGAAMLPTKGPG
jgi:hypothetical protein